MDGNPSEGEDGMKKPAPPTMKKAELVLKATMLLSGSKDPVEAVEWLLNQFTGWDLEAIIEKLRSEDGKTYNR